MANLTQNIVALRGLLGSGLVDSDRYAAHPLRRCISLVLHHHVIAQPVIRDYENVRLSLLMKNLNEIKAFDSRLLRKFRRNILRSDEHTYYGVRLEVSVAASLIRANVPFIKTESPDFTLVQPFKKAFVECGSVHLTRSTSTIDDFKKKIESVLRQKSSRKYCHPGTAIFVDATNLHFFATRSDSICTPSVDKELLIKLMTFYTFGSTIIWTYLLNPAVQKYQWKYTRQDSPNIHESLRCFLDHVYPLGQDFTPGARFLPHV